MDISPYNGTLYVASIWGDIYAIDPGTLSITKRYAFITIGPNGFQTSSVKVLSDGRLALLSAGAVNGSFNYNAASAAIWDPVSNSLDTGANGTICPAVTTINSFTVSGDRTHVLLAGSGTVCSYDPVAKQATSGVFPTLTGSGSSPQIIPTPDGKRFFLTAYVGAVPIYDATTAQMLGQINTSSASASRFGVMSLDGKTLYLDTGIAYDATSLQQIGWIPSFGQVNIPSIDGTGLIFVGADPGATFLDATQIKTTQPTTIQNGTTSPATGPLSGGTALSGFAAATITDGATVSQIYVGNAPGSGATLGSSAQVTTPPSSQTGAVDLTEILSDGGIAIQPEAFNYGPTILAVPSNVSTAQGGLQGIIQGYGFGQSPQVTVGGAAAQGVSVTPGIIPSGSPVYPPNPDTLNFTIPPGTAGTAADVTVTTAAGSATAKGAFHYTAAFQYFAVPGGMPPAGPALEQGIYDPHRDVYYFTGQIQYQSMGQPRVLAGC